MIFLYLELYRANVYKGNGMAGRLRKQNDIHGLDVYGPLEQAARCLDRWLAEEGRRIDAFSRQRAAALMARYFHYEDEVTDETMLSFLRHYSGKRELDMEDPTSVRMTLKTVLDASLVAAEKSRLGRRIAIAVFAVALAVLGGGGWVATHARMTAAQQTHLKTLVAQVAAHEKSVGATTAAVWSGVKKPLHVRRYQDISWWGYYRAALRLEERLKK
jgi:hypothetical protein